MDDGSTSALRRPGAATAAGSPIDYRAVFEALPGLYLLLGPDLRILSASDAYLKATFTRREDIVGRDMFVVFTDNLDNRSRTGVRNLRASLERVLTTKVSDPMPVQRYDVRQPADQGGGYAERYWSPINSPVLDARGEVVCIVHRVEDVTAYWRMRRAHGGRSAAARPDKDQSAAEIYRNAEAILAVNNALRESEERVRVALLHAPIFLYTLDRDLRFNWVANPPRHLRAAAMIGRRDDEILPAAAAQRLIAFKSRILETGRGNRTEMSLDVEGETLFYDMTAEPLRNAAGEVVGLTVAAIDITERRQHENARMRLVEELKLERSRLEQALAERTKLLGRIVSTQESERQRIARELHDRLGQYLTSLTLALDALERTMQGSGTGASRVAALKALTAEVGREVDNLAWEMRPIALDHLGMHTVLSDYLEDWSERTHIPVEFHNGLRPERLADAVETTFYRVLQEAMTNVAKHAKARHVSVILERLAGEFRLVVEDDGRGFDPDRVTRGRSRRLGLVGASERLELLGGSLDIESEPGRGATLYARLPA